MDDDKAIEAARRELRRIPRLSGRFTDGELDQIIRAALAAADKVRAGEEFDFEDEARYAWLKETENAIDWSLRRAFAAGLAKGDAERAALVEALKPFAWFASLLPKSVPDYMPLKADLSGSGDLTVAHLRAAALALVRKGV